MPAVASRTARLDPLALPVRFTAPDAAADGRVRLVEIDSERVLLSRSVRGMAIRVRVPVKAFLGVAAQAAPAPAGAEIVLRLEHSDPGLSIELFSGTENADVAAEWELWGRVLGLPLLTADQADKIRGAATKVGTLVTAKPGPRRRRRNAIRQRRPRMALRRKAGKLEPETPVHREREIIARD